MKTLHFCLSFMMILAISMSQCPSGQTEKVFSNSLNQISLCIPTINIIQNCAYYNLDIQTPPYSCLACPTGFNKVKFDEVIDQINQICDDQSTTSYRDCGKYNNKNALLCIQCRSGFTAFPIPLSTDVLTVVKCRSDIQLMIGDNQLWSTCKYYNPTSQSHCNTCQAFTGAKTYIPKSRDCSQECHNDLPKKSVYYYGTGDTWNHQCVSKSKATCKRYVNTNWRGCNQCFEGDQFVRIRKSGYLFQTCIPQSQLIPGCERYKQYNTRTEKNFLHFCFTCFPVENQTVTYYEQHRSCLTGIDNIIGKCQEFKPDNISCATCEMGYILKHEQNICIKRVEFCSQYSETGVCKQCIPQYFLLAQVCRPISEECLSVNQLTGSCTQCKTGFTPSQTQLGACDISTICPNRQYYDVVEASCQPGTIQNCLVYPEGGLVCLQCEQDFTYKSFQNICQPIPQQVICPEESVAVQGVCKQLSAGCTQYRISSITGDPICEICSDAYYHFEGKCYLKINP